MAGRRSGDIARHRDPGGDRRDDDGQAGQSPAAAANGSAVAVVAACARGRSGPAELGPGQRGGRGVGQVGRTALNRLPTRDSTTMDQTRTPIAPASCERTSEPSPTPMAASSAAARTGPGRSGPAGVTDHDVIPAGRHDDQSGAGRPRPARPNTAPAAAGHALGGQHPVPARRGQVGQRGGGVPELAAGDGHPEHRRQEQGPDPAGDIGRAGRGAQRRARPGRRRGPTPAPKTGRSARRGGQQAVVQPDGAELEQFDADQPGHRDASLRARARSV